MLTQIQYDQLIALLAKYSNDYAPARCLVAAIESQVLGIPREPYADGENY